MAEGASALHTDNYEVQSVSEVKTKGPYIKDVRTRRGGGG